MAPNIRIFKREVAEDVSTTPLPLHHFKDHHHRAKPPITSTETYGKFDHYIFFRRLLKLNENRDIPFENRMFKNYL